MAGGPDIASLGLSVDSSGVDAASVSLDRLGNAAQAAGTRVGGMQQAASAASGAAAAASTGINRLATASAAAAAALGRANVTTATTVTQISAAQLAAAQAGVTAINAMGAAAGTAGTHVNNFGRQMQLSGQQAQFLSYQINDIFTSIGSGMSPFQILAQQGGQVYQALSMGPGGVGGSLRAVGSMITAAITPARLLVGGLASIGAAGAIAAYQWRSAQADIRAAIAGIGAASGATVQNINEIAAATARSTTLSVGSARETASAFAQVRTPVGLLGDSILLTRQYSKQMGVDFEAAREILVKAMKDPAAGAELLNAEIGRIDARTRQYITTLTQQGERERAIVVLQNATRQALGEATNGVNVLANAWNNLTNLASRGWNALGEGVNRMMGGGTNEQLLEDARRQLESLRRQRSSAIGGALDFLVPGTNERAAQQETALEERIRTLQGRIDEAARRATETLQVEMADKATSIVNGILEDLGRLNGIRGQITQLEKARQDPAVMERMGVSAEAVDEAIARLTSQLDNFQSTVDRMREDQALELRSIDATTLAQRAQVEVDRELAQARRDGLTPLQQSIAAEGARNRVIAEANREAREAARIAQQNASLVGLRPFERAMQENRYRDEERRRNMSVGSGVITTPVAPVPGAPGPLVPMPGTGSTAGPRVSFAGNMPGGRVNASPEQLERIVSGAVRVAENLGVSARDLLTIMSFETGGTMNPNQPGPRTQWGQHRGLIQMGVPQARESGVTDFNNIEQQMAGVERYFRGRGVRPGMSGLQMYAAVNGGNINAVNARDGHNGGTPGTVTDKWRNQMNDDRRLADRLLGGVTQVSSGMPQLTPVPDRRETVPVPTDTATGDLDGAARAEQEATRWQHVEGPLRDANDQLDTQIALNARLSETWGRSTLEITRASEAQRLMNQYQMAGVNAATIGQAAYDTLAAKVMDYAQRAGEAAQAQEDLARRQELVSGMNDALRDGFSSFISDLRQGKDASEALANALNRVLDNVLNMVINNAFSFGGQQGGLFGGIMSLLGMGGGTPGFAGARAGGGPVYAGGSHLVGEHGPELFTPSTPGHITPGGGGGLKVIINEGSGTQASVSQGDDGSLQIDTMVRMAEGKMADRVGRNQGPLAKASRASMSRANLRG